MNKLLLAVFAVSMFTVPACAQGALQLPPHWQDALKQQVSTSTFQHAMTTLGKPLLLTIPVTKQYFLRNSSEAEIPFNETARYRQITNAETYPSTAGCKAYALDEHWVLAGGTCLWNGRHNIEFTDKSGAFATGLVEPDPARKDLQINGSKIPWANHLFIQPHEHQVPHVILVHVPESSSLSRRLKNWPKINVYAFQTKTPAFLQGGDFYIHTARFGLNLARKRTLERVNTSKTVTLKNETGDLSGVSTDPLMFMSHGQLHWVGANNGITNLRYGNLLGDWDGETSNEYFYFTAQDAQFIKETILRHDPVAWLRIEARKGLEIL